METNLSEDQKRRIEEEEAIRIAEEEYREEVRRSMRSTAAPAQIPPGLPKSVRHLGSLGFVITAILVVFIGVAWLRSASFQPSGDLLSRWVPVTAPLVNGRFPVRAQNYVSWTINVPGTAVRNYRVVGHYSAVGGGGNDVQAVVATEDEFQNWINGHPARTFYSTGRVTTGHIDLALPPSRYVLAFNNRFSFLTDKTVFAEIDANYEQLK